MKNKPSLMLADVKKMLAAAEAEAIKNNWNVVIAVLDDGANLLYLQRMDGTQLGSIEVAQQKGACAIRFKRPSKAFADMVNGGTPGMMSLRGVVPVEGGLPLTVDGQIVGAIGVSGVKSDQDGLVAKAGADAAAALS